MTFAFEGENFCVRIVSHEIRSIPQEFEVVVRPAVVLCIPFNQDGRVVLVRQYRAALDGVTLEFPAGAAESGEDLECAVRRELLEEIGYLVTNVERLGTFLTAPHFSDELVTVFTASGQISSPPTPTPKEDLREILEIPPSAVKKLIEDGQLVDSKSLAAYMLACTRGSLLGITL